MMVLNQKANQLSECETVWKGNITAQISINWQNEQKDHKLIVDSQSIFLRLCSSCYQS